MDANLISKFQSMARIYSTSTLDDSDDLSQDMLLACLERSQKSPDFFSQNESYILHAGRLEAWGKLRAKRTFDRYQYYAYDNEQGESELDFIASAELSPEDALEHKQALEAIARAFATLSDREKTVVLLTVDGTPTNGIASRLGVTAAAVSGYKARAIRKFQAALEV